MRIIIYCLIIVLSCTSCASKSQPTKNKSSITGYKPITEQSLIYHYNTDAQFDLGQYTSYAYTKDGYYHMRLLKNDMYQITFTDQKANKTVPVCTKSNCNHQTATCDANFESNYNEDHSSKSKDYYIGYGYFQYYKGVIYLPVKKGDYVNLLKVSADGSTRTTALQLCRFLQITKKNGDATDTASYYPMLKIHRNHIYFTNDELGGKTATLYCKNLKTGSLEKIAHFNKNKPTIYSTHPYGNYVFCILAQTINGKLKTFLYAYNKKTKQTMLCGKNVIPEYTIAQGYAYFPGLSGSSSIYRLKLGTAKPHLLIKIPKQEDENIIFFTNKDYVIAQVVKNDDTFGSQIVLKGTKKIAYYKKSHYHPYQDAFS